MGKVGIHKYREVHFFHIPPNLFICNYVHPFTFPPQTWNAEFTDFYFVWSSMCVCTHAHVYTPMPMCLMHYFGNQVFSPENSHLFLKCHVHWILKERSPVAGQGRAMGGNWGSCNWTTTTKRKKDLSEPQELIPDFESYAMGSRCMNLWERVFSRAIFGEINACCYMQLQPISFNASLCH